MGGTWKPEGTGEQAQHPWGARMVFHRRKSWCWQSMGGKVLSAEGCQHVQRERAGRVDGDQKPRTRVNRAVLQSLLVREAGKDGGSGDWRTHQTLVRLVA